MTRLFFSFRICFDFATLVAFQQKQSEKMSKVQGVGLHIVRDTMEMGSLCTCAYHYSLLCDESECDSDAEFEVVIEVWANDAILDKRLGHANYDFHKLSGKRHHDVNRSFVIPCEVLNADIGIDEIYIQVCVTDPLGRTNCYPSPIIKDHF